MRTLIALCLLKLLIDLGFGVYYVINDSMKGVTMFVFGYHEYFVGRGVKQSPEGVVDYLKSKLSLFCFFKGLSTLSV